MRSDDREMGRGAERSGVGGQGEEVTHHKDKGDKRETCDATAEPNDFTIRLSSIISMNIGKQESWMHAR